MRLTELRHHEGANRRRVHTWAVSLEWESLLLAPLLRAPLRVSRVLALVVLALAVMASVVLASWHASRSWIAQSPPSLLEARVVASW